MKGFYFFMQVLSANTLLLYPAAQEKVNTEKKVHKAGFIHIISTKRINQMKKENCKKKISFMHTKRFITFFKIWLQFRVGAIPRLPENKTKETPLKPFYLSYFV